MSRDNVKIDESEMFDEWVKHQTGIGEVVGTPGNCGKCHPMYCLYLRMANKCPKLMNSLRGSLRSDSNQ